MMTEFHVSEAGHYPTNVPNHSREREKRKETGLAVPLRVVFFPIILYGFLFAIITAFLWLFYGKTAVLTTQTCINGAGNRPLS